MMPSTALVLWTPEVYAGGIMSKPTPMHFYESRHTIYPTVRQFAVMHDKCANATSPKNYYRIMMRLVEGARAVCVICGKENDPARAKLEIVAQTKRIDEIVSRQKQKAALQQKTALQDSEPAKEINQPSS